MPLQPVATVGYRRAALRLHRRLPRWPAAASLPLLSPLAANSVAASASVPIPAVAVLPPPGSPVARAVGAATDAAALCASRGAPARGAADACAAGDASGSAGRRSTGHAAVVGADCGGCGLCPEAVAQSPVAAAFFARDRLSPPELTARPPLRAAAAAALAAAALPVLRSPDARFWADGVAPPLASLHAALGWAAVEPLLGSLQAAMGGAFGGAPLAALIGAADFVVPPPSSLDAERWLRCACARAGGVLLEALPLARVGRAAFGAAGWASLMKSPVSQRRVRAYVRAVAAARPELVCSVRWCPDSREWMLEFGGGAGDNGGEQLV